jgi:hypothetical protein
VTEAGVPELLGRLKRRLARQDRLVTALVRASAAGSMNALLPLSVSSKSRAGEAG